MPSTRRASAKQIRRSVSLPQRIAKQVEAIAKQRALSDNRVLVELIEQGIEASRQKEKAFFQLAERFRAANDPEQVKQLGNELGRFVFGQDRWLVNSREAISAKIRRGLDQLDRGEGIPEDQLDAYMARMKTQTE
jgi:predicted transcriptional regulator